MLNRKTRITVGTGLSAIAILFLADHAKANFLIHCENPAANASIRHTVTVLKNQVQEKNCKQAYQKLKERRELGLYEEKITDLRPLRGLENLEKLELPYNEISDISPLAGLSQLKVLDLSGNKIKTLRSLKSLVGLAELDLSDNSIEDLSPLAGFKSLFYLNLYNNPIGKNIAKTAANCPQSEHAILLSEFCASKVQVYIDDSHLE